MAINNENETVNFNIFLTGEEKANFVKYLIQKQLNLAKFMNELCQDSFNILHDHKVLMEAAFKSNIPKILSDKLNGAVTFIEYSQIFLSVMDEYFDSLF